MEEHTTIDFTRVFDIIGYQQKKYPQSKALLQLKNGQWEGYSISEVQKKVDIISCWLLEHGFEQGTCISVIPRMGSPEWMMVDLASLQAGLTIVPIHPISTTEEIEFILNETGATICIAADSELHEKIKSLMGNVPSLQWAFQLENEKEDYFPPLLLENISTDQHEALNLRKKQIKEEDLLAIMYTSGTSGISKGALLTHGNVVSNIKSILTVLPLQPGHRALSFLPYSHIFERTSSYAYMAFGVQIHFSQSIENLTHDFRSVKPFFCTSVPRTLEKMYNFLLEQRQGKSWLKKILITWAMSIGEKYKDKQAAALLFVVQLFFARLWVLNRWRKGLGGHLRYMAVGAAALRPEIGRLFSAAGIQVLSGYGMTEASPFISVNRYQPGLNRFGTVGTPVPGVEIKLDNPDENGEGEILVKGPNIMKGYFKRPELTREVFTDDGWLKTGDVGKMVEKRFLSITDRKKDIFKTSAGKYIAPQPLENHFCSSPFIVQCLILGFNKPYVTAILVPNFSFLKTWCEGQGIHWTSPPFMVHNIKVLKKFQEETERLNATLQNFERIRNFILSDEEWTVESKDLTTSFKPRRNKLLEMYRGEIEKMYL